MLLAKGGAILSRTMPPPGKHAIILCMSPYIGFSGAAKKILWSEYLEEHAVVIAAEKAAIEKARPEKIKAARKRARVAYRLAHPEKMRKKKREQRHRSNARKRAEKLAWRLANPGWDNERKAEMARRLLERKKLKKARYRARDRNAQGVLSRGLIGRLMKAQKSCCACCQKELAEYQLDHIIALSNGGSNDDLNIQLLCPLCNGKKSDKHPVEFMQECGYLL